MKKVLIVDDDLFLAHSVAKIVSHLNLKSEVAGSFASAISKLEQSKVDAVILDRQLPDVDDGLELLSYFASQNISLPVLILSNRTAVTDRILGISAGAFDYLPKPFASAELIARLNNILSLSRTSIEDSFEYGPLVVYPNQGKVEVSGQTLPLRKKEVDILYLLVKSSPRLVSRPEIIRAVWGNQSPPSDNTIDCYIKRLRQLVPLANFIQTRRGFGYKVDKLPGNFHRASATRSTKDLDLTT